MSYFNLMLLKSTRRHILPLEEEEMLVPPLLWLLASFLTPSEMF